MRRGDVAKRSLLKFPCVGHDLHFAAHGKGGDIAGLNARFGVKMRAGCGDPMRRLGELCQRREGKPAAKSVSPGETEGHILFLVDHGEGLAEAKLSVTFPIGAGKKIDQGGGDTHHLAFGECGGANDTL